ncbi:uncharacterized protein [Lolium perenne]|uniref:uncharacterized protein isoform X2 n=1 Tax=Lolium perenne TaxID=4522 RepID=UPI0021F631DD|nr:uncharacterized protein LOC127348270 isoform X2 [Lolium perenne]
MFPSECVLERRVRSDGDKELADPSLPLFILKCEHRKADRYELDPYDYNQTLQGMVIGVCLADAPAAVSYLVILGAGVYAQIAAVDKTLIVIKLSFAGTGGRLSYLIYDAVALSLRLIPLQPRDPNWAYTLSYNISIARPYQGDATYALVHTGQLAGPEPQEGDSLYLWRPSSSSSPPWSERKQCSFPEDWITNKIDMEFSFYGQAYWVDLVCGVSFCCCDALFDDNSGPAVQFGFIPLPLEERGHYRNLKLLAQPSAYRTMGVVSDSFIRTIRGSWSTSSASRCCGGSRGSPTCPRTSRPCTPSSAPRTRTSSTWHSASASRAFTRALGSSSRAVRAICSRLTCRRRSSHLYLWRTGFLTSTSLAVSAGISVML